MLRPETLVPTTATPKTLAQAHRCFGLVAPHIRDETGAPFPGPCLVALKLVILQFDEGNLRRFVDSVRVFGPQAVAATFSPPQRSLPSTVN